MITNSEYVIMMVWRICVIVFLVFVFLHDELYKFGCHYLSSIVVIVLTSLFIHDVVSITREWRLKE